MNYKFLRLTKYKICNELVKNKQDWEYQFSSRCLQLTIKDLAQTWQMFFDKFKQYMIYKCGYIKQGNAKYHTKHNEYICYQCGNCMDRDENAV